MDTEFAHESVLLKESLDALNIQQDGIYIDATFGRGGHSGHILNALGEKGQLHAFDRDPEAIDAAKKFSDDGRFTIHHSAFSRMAEVAETAGIKGKVDGILMDLGVSSPQLDDANRGFSFMRNGPLDMRMDTTRGQSASEWLATADEADIADVIKSYGEEKFGKRIAHAIVTTRAQSPITTTSQLAELIDDAVPVKDKFKHPATRAFQGIRIFINRELDEVEEALNASLSVLKPGGRLAVISFHSLEDRMVKRFIRAQSKGKDVPAHLPVTSDEIDATKKMNAIGRAIKPSEEEVAHNPRARSSVLRVAEKR